MIYRDYSALDKYVITENYRQNICIYKMYVFMDFSSFTLLLWRTADISRYFLLFPPLAITSYQTVFANLYTSNPNTLFLSTLLVKIVTQCYLCFNLINFLLCMRVL